MQPTRKLQMAADLIEEAAEDLPDGEHRSRAEELAGEVDAIRGPIHMQIAQRRIDARTARQ